MPLITRNPTANTTPDPAQGGNAVTGNINTGYGSTLTSDGVGAGTASKSCIWTGFVDVVGQRSLVELKLDWTEDGTLADGNNSFRIQYSLNAGGVWNTIFNHADVIAPQSSSSTVLLPNTQDLSQVQVRALTVAAAVSVVATITTSISNIRIEVTPLLNNPSPVFVA